MPLPINLPSWDTPRRTADDILSTVGAPGRGVHAVSMTNKMAHFSSYSSSPEPGQIFTVRSISGVINADGDGEIFKPVQIDSASTTPTPATADPISEPPPRSSSPITRRPLPRYPRKQVGNDDLIASIDQDGQKLTDHLGTTITSSRITTK